MPITRLGDASNQARQVGFIDITRILLDRLVTAVKPASGKLRAAGELGHCYSRQRGRRK